MRTTYSSCLILVNIYLYGPSILCPLLITCLWFLIYSEHPVTKQVHLLEKSSTVSLPSS